MVTRQSRQTAQSVNQLLEQRDVLGLVSVAAGTAGGVLLTQRVANTVLPAIGLSPTPNTLLEGVGSAGVKGAIAAAFMFGALQVSGMPQVLLAFLSVGALTSAGFDLAALFFDVPSLRHMNNSTNGLTASTGGASARVVSSSTSRATTTDPDAVEFRSSNNGHDDMMGDEISFR